MPLSSKERQQRFRDRQKLPEEAVQLLARVKTILTTYPRSYHERLGSVVAKFEGERVGPPCHQVNSVQVRSVRR